MDERLKKQMEFALEIDKEKNIFRQTHLSGSGRNENDAEHAWHMAIITVMTGVTGESTQLQRRRFTAGIPRLKKALRHFLIWRI